MLSQEATNTLILIGGTVMALLLGAFTALTNWLSSRRADKHDEKLTTHLQTNVSQPITSALSNLEGTLGLQQKAYENILQVKDRQIDETTARLATLQKTVDDYKLLADQSLTDREGIRAQLNEVLDKQKARDIADQRRDDQIKALEEANQSKDTIIEELRTKIAALEASLTSKDTDLAVANATIAELNRQLDEAQKVNIEVTELKHRVEALEAQVNALMNDKEQLALENAQLRQQIAERDAIIADLRQQLADKPEMDSTKPIVGLKERQDIAKIAAGLESAANGTGNEAQ